MILILSLSKDEDARDIDAALGDERIWERTISAFVYIVRCSDGSYYTGSTRGSLDDRVNQHNVGSFGGYTKSRLPVRLVFAQHFQLITEAISAERQLKGWRRAKKEALIRGDLAALVELSRNRALQAHPSTGSG